ncbi:MAG: sulfite exporter TauE/SafE family protein [Chloroflexi bacterium]|nr:sulfite exporter TauE/SafE family protein [Chloroflexota bacterium]
MLGLGAITMIPLLLFVPPALGFPPLDMKTVAGLSMVQVVFATFSGVVAHRRNESVNRDLVLFMGGGSLIGSLAGGVFSSYMSSRALSFVFATLALSALILMLLPPRRVQPAITAANVEFNRILAFFMAVTVGSIAAMVGAGGAFIFIPLMLFVLKIPTRIAIGSTLGVVFLGAFAGAVGKISTGQVVFPLAAALVIGALPGAQIGGLLSKRVRPGLLRNLLTAFITAAAIKMWYDLLAGG